MTAAAGLKAAEAGMDADAQEAAMEEIRATLGTMTSQLNDLKTKSDMSVNFGINTDLRYDYQQYSTATMATTASKPANNVYYVTAPLISSKFPNGYDGMYAKRVEVEFKGKTASWAQWHLQ